MYKTLKYGIQKTVILLLFKVFKTLCHCTQSFVDDN